MTQPIRVASPGDFIELMPFLLGYTPENSLVLHGIIDSGPAGPTMALPLPADPTQWRAVAEAAAPDFLRYSNDRGHDLRDVVACLYRNPQPGQSPEETADLLGHLADWIIDAFCELGDAPIKIAIGIVGRHWWDYACHWPDCCEGEPLPVGDDPESVTAQLRALGRSPGRPSSEIASEFRPSDTNATRYRQAISQAWISFTQDSTTPRARLLRRQSTLRVIDAAVHDLRNGLQINDEVAARIIFGLGDRESRDRALSRGSEDDLPYERQLWAELARRCVPPHTDLAPAPLTLFAWVAWRQGDTVAARHALRDALTIDSRYTLAGHLHEGLNQGVPVEAFLDICRTDACEGQARDEAALRSP
jgi:hypothetical protein